MVVVVDWWWCWAGGRSNAGQLGAMLASRSDATGGAGPRREAASWGQVWPRAPALVFGLMLLVVD